MIPLLLLASVVAAPTEQVATDINPVDDRFEGTWRLDENGFVGYPSDGKNKKSNHLFIVHGSLFTICSDGKTLSSGTIRILSSRENRFEKANSDDGPKACGIYRFSENDRRLTCWMGGASEKIKVTDWARMWFSFSKVK